MSPNINAGAESLWRARFTQDAPVDPVSHVAMDRAFNRFLDVVQANHLQVGSVPRTLLPFSVQGSASLDRITLCLQRSTEKQDQLDLIGEIPSDLAKIEEAFGHGMQFACQDLQYGGRVLPDNRATLLEALSYTRAKVAAFRLLSKSPKRLPMLTYKRFFTELEQGSRYKFEKTLSEADKVILTRLAVLASIEGNHRGSILALVEWARRAKNSLNLDVWHLLMNPVRLAGSQVRNLLHILEYLIELGDHSEATARVPLLLSKTPYLRYIDLEHLLLDIRQRYLFSKFPLKDLEETLDSFRVQDTPLPSDETNFVAETYKNIEKLSGWAQSTSSTTFSTTIDKLHSKARQPSGLCAADLEQLVALARDGVRRILGIQPYNTQVLTVIALLNVKKDLRGRISQVKTGEGKSTIVAMLAAILGVQGRRVDIISSARPLAVRDQEKYKPYFKLFNLNVSHVCTDYPNTSHFSAPILYGTNYDFEFSLLRDGLLNTNLRTDRISDVAIVDEVDDLFIDQGTANAIISVTADDPFAWIVPAIHDFMSHLDDRGKNGIRLQKALVFLRSYQNGRFARDVNGLTIDKLSTWLRSCQRSLHVLKENEDYVLRIPREGAKEDGAGKKQVVIVDRGTGQLKESSRWEQREHQFVEHKHGLDIQPETKTGAELSHPIFFGGYKLLLGLTGTLGAGAEREEMSAVYNIDSFDVPPHTKGRREIYSSIFCNTKQEHYAALKSEIDDMRIAGRPILILMNSIQETHHFRTFLGDERSTVQLFNAVQDEDEAFIVARAGGAGVTTIATNAGGRGTDILVSPASLAAGGLHVVFGFYPNNQRIEDQGFGRAARQGQLGSSRMVIDRSSLSESQGGLTATAATLHAERSLRAMLEVDSRLQIAKQTEVTNASMTEFFAHLKMWHSSHTDEFRTEIAAWLQDLSKSSVFAQRASDDGKPQVTQVLRRHLVSLLQSVTSVGGGSDHWAAWFPEFERHVTSNKQQQWADFFTFEKEILGRSTSIREPEEHRKRFRKFMTDQTSDLNDLTLFWQKSIYKLLED